MIGSVGTYSGPTGITNKQGPRALQAWAAQINAKGGINGRKVEVVVLNDGGDAAKSRSQVQELVEQRKVTALVSSFAGTSATKAWGPYVADKKVPVIGGACRDGWNDNPVLFNQCPSVESMAYGAVATGANYGRGKKFGALFCQEGGVCSQVEKLWFDSGYAKRAGLEPKYRARVSLTQPDFTSECIQARNAGVELLSVVADPNTLTRVASSCRRQNFNPEYLQPMNTVDAGTAGQTGLGNVMVPTGVFPFAGLSTPAYNEFATAWKRYGDGNAPGPSAAMGWAGAKIFEKAARAAGKDISSANLLKQLYKFRGERFGGLTVPLTFVAGKGTADSKCTFFMRARNGKWTAPSGDRPYCF